MILTLLDKFGAKIDYDEKKEAFTVFPSPLKGIQIDARQIPDLVPVLAVVAAVAEGDTEITGAKRLRDKESDRLSTTAAMLRAGADAGATGESAIRYQCKTADVIVGVAGILHANAMMGEISPAIAAAVSLSEGQKVLVPLERCGLCIAGVGRQPLDSLIREAARMAVDFCSQTE